MAAVTAQPHSSFLLNLPGPCEHKVNLGCMLSALPCCCSCADRRPEATAYPVYIDGQGMRMKGRRWQRYCRKCYDHWQSLVSEPDPSAVSDSSDGPSTTVQAAELVDTRTALAMPPMRHGQMTSHNPFNAFSTGHSRDSSFDANFSLENLQITSTVTQTRHQYSRHITRPNPLVQPEEVTPHGHPASQQTFPLGTREEALQDDYTSPIGDMFTRAWDRYRDVQQARAAYRRAQQDVSEGMDAALQSVSESGTAIVPEHGHLVDTRWVNPDSPLRQNPLGQNSEPAPLPQRPYSGRSNFHSRLYMSNPFDATPRDRRDFSRVFGTDDPSDERSVIDRQERPKPIKESDMKVDFTCKVCKEQKIDTICFPCMHACMCHFCALCWKDGCKVGGRFDPSLWTCPTCRKKLKETRRFYI